MCQHSLPCSIVDAHCLLPGRAFASLYVLLFLEKEAEIGGCDFHHSVFFCEILDWHRYFIHKLEYIARLLVKKDQYPTGICLFPDGNEMDQMVRNYMRCHFAPFGPFRFHLGNKQLLGLLFGTHTFNFNCFFKDFNCV